MAKRLITSRKTKTKKRVGAVDQAAAQRVRDANRARAIREDKAEYEASKARRYKAKHPVRRDQERWRDAETLLQRRERRQALSARAIARVKAKAKRASASKRPTGKKTRVKATSTRSKRS